MPDQRGALVAVCVSVLLTACTAANERTAGPESGDSEIARLIEQAQSETAKGELPAAGRLLDQALAIERSDPALWVAIARLRYRGGEDIGALEAADLALSLDQQFAPALLMRAQLVRDAHGMEAALAWFERALEANPDDADLLAEYAATLGDLGRNRDMLEAARKLAEAHPDDPRIHFLHAVLAARAGDPVLASSLLKRSKADSAAAIQLGALIDMQQGNFDSAASSLENLAASQPENARVQDLLARALWLGERDRELTNRFAERAGSDAASPYLNMLVGRAYERLGQRADAAGYIERALAGRGDGVAVLLADAALLPDATARMRDLVKAGRRGEAQVHAEDILEKFAGSSDVSVLAGDAALERGDYAGALEQFGQAAQISRPWPLTRKIIHAYREAGDDDAAEALLIRHLRGEPLNTEAIVMLAQSSAADEDWQRVSLLINNAVGQGAANDPALLELRLQAARALGDDAMTERTASALAQLRPGPFLNR